MDYINFIPFKHTYSLVTNGLKKDYNKIFESRNSANQYMYNLLKKYHLHIEEVYDDKHYKTYNCGNDVKIYIQRNY